MNTPNTPLSADLPADIREYLATVPPVSEQDLAELRKASEALDHDPAFQADFLKSLFVERMLEAMEELGETQSALALRWNCSRQYVSKLFNQDRKVNFTIETLCELAHLLKRRVAIEVLRENEVAHVMRCVPMHREIEPLEAHWAGPATRRHPVDDLQARFGGSRRTPARIPNTAYEVPELAA
jgi:transcriptional regulator with XRE-family HTH domain